MQYRRKLARFKLQKDKCLEAICHIASEWPGITQYFVCKAFYFADKEHYLDWGRPISGDFYVAMPHGPVPSRIYELLKPDSGEEDDWLEGFDHLIETRVQGKLTHVQCREKIEYRLLSRTDISSLSKWVSHFKSLPYEARFKEVERLSHEERAWLEARELPGNAPEMNLARWGEELGISEEEFQATISEVSKFAALQFTKVAGHSDLVS